MPEWDEIFDVVVVGSGGVGLSLLSPSPPEGIKLLVEFVELRWRAATAPSAPADDRVTPMDGSLAAMRLIAKCELRVFCDREHWAMIEPRDEFESTVLAYLAQD